MRVYRNKQRKNEWWVYFRFRGRRVRRRSPIQTRRGAEEFGRRLLRELGDDLALGRDPFAGPPPTLAEFAPRWMREYVATNNRPSTVDKKAEILRIHLLPELGHLRLDQITADRIDSVGSRMTARGLKAKTVNNALSVLHRCLRSACRWRVIASFPKFEWLTVHDPTWRFLTEVEEQALVDATPIGFWQALVVFILHTGVRFSEAAAVTWDDLDLARPEPVVRITKGGSRGKPGPTKTGSHRELPLDAVVLAELASLARDADQVFPKPSGGQMNPASKLKYLHAFCRRAGIRPCGWHVLRHTFGSRLGTRGVPLPVLQKLLGHTTLKMTMRYVHVDPGTMRATARVVEHLMAAPTRFVHQVSTNATKALLTA
jgi:integrase